jgi:hypothetical protein
VQRSTCLILRSFKLNSGYLFKTSYMVRSFKENILIYILVETLLLWSNQGDTWQRWQRLIIPIQLLSEKLKWQDHLGNLGLNINAISCCNSPCGGGLGYLHGSRASRRRRRKGNPVPGVITGPPCHWGDINTETWSSRLGVGRKADYLAL